MLNGLILLLLLLWGIGLITSYSFGGLIHILLVAALIILVINLLAGRRV